MITTNKASHTSADLLGYFTPDEFTTSALPGGEFRGGMMAECEKWVRRLGLEEEENAPT